MNNYSIRWYEEVLKYKLYHKNINKKITNLYINKCKATRRKEIEISKVNNGKTIKKMN
jgi:hypothetical protein